MDKKPKSWMTPFVKQCFVVLGVSLTMGQMGLVMGFSSVLLPQLKMANSSIIIDEESGSWIASIPGISIMGGNLLIPYIMGKYGRKAGYITALVFSLVGWVGIFLSNNAAALLATRFMQGVALGMILSLGPLLIGEYASPVNRGVFLMTISIVIGFGVFAIHTMGSYLSWKTTSLICIIVTVVDLLLAVMSPESPSWLADQGRYEECRKTFRWLRGDTEDEELEKMIDANVATRKAKENEIVPNECCVTKLKNGFMNSGKALKNNDLYKPLIIMSHLYAMAQWSGVNLMASYAVDFVNTVIGRDVNIPLMIISLDVQRIISNTIALIVIKKMKRRMVMFISVGLNTLTLFVIAAYTFAKLNGYIALDDYYNFYIGTALVHFLIFTIGVGALPLSFILAGEIFPLRYKSMAGSFSCIFFSLNLFVNIKTVPFLLNTVNVYGLYMLYGCFLIYLLLVVGLMLPETKDKTLQDIEEEFRGLKKVKKSKTESGL